MKRNERILESAEATPGAYKDAENEDNEQSDKNDAVIHCLSV